MWRRRKDFHYVSYTSHPVEWTGSDSSRATTWDCIVYAHRHECRAAALLLCNCCAAPFSCVRRVYLPEAGNRTVGGLLVSCCHSSALGSLFGMMSLMLLCASTRQLST